MSYEQEDQRRAARARHAGDADAAPAARKKRSLRAFLAKPEVLCFLVVLGVLIAVRVGLLLFLTPYVNGVLGEANDYTGRLGGISMTLWRGAYQIEDLELDKARGGSSEPLLAANRIDLSLHWLALLRGKIVGDAVVHRPVVHLVAEPSAKESEEEETGLDADLPTRLEKLFPFEIERFAVRDASLRYRAPDREPQLDLYIEDLYVEATGLTNVRDSSSLLPAQIEAAGRPFGTGELELRVRFDPLASPPVLDLWLELRRVPLVELNDFFLAYGDFDVEEGELDLSLELATRNGRVVGYVKPLFTDLDVARFGEIESPADALQAFWEAIVGGGAEALENQPHDRLGTKIPIDGELSDIRADLWATIAALLENAFIRALLPGQESEIDLSAPALAAGDPPSAGESEAE